MRSVIQTYVDRQLPVYRQLALDLHAHPEVCNTEYHACEVLSAQLRAEGI